MATEKLIPSEPPHSEPFLKIQPRAGVNACRVRKVTLRSGGFRFAEKRSGSMEATSPISRRSLRQASNFWSVVILVCAINPGSPTPGVRGLASQEVML